MDLDDSTLRHSLKIALAASGILITLLLYLSAHRNWKKHARIAIDLALIAATVAAIAAYFEFGHLRYGQYMNPHDCFHYYVGAKYSNEHHYADLYRCTLVADAELGQKYTAPRIRDLDTHQLVSTFLPPESQKALIARFTPERWTDFKQDIAYFRNQMPPSKWNMVLQDKGYNATPVWNAFARILTNAIPTSSPWGMRFLTYLDLFLLTALFALVCNTFGWRVMALALLFYGTNYFMSFVNIKGAILRLDWLAATVAAFCLLHRNKYKTAGAFMAIATCSRVFPLLFAFPLGCKMLWNGYEAWRTRKLETKAPLNRDYLAFFATFGIAAAALVLGSIALDGGLDLWRAFFAKIAVHNADISPLRIGFKYIFLESAHDKAAEFLEYALLWKCILLTVLVLTAFLARKVNDHETIALGLLPIFFLTAPTFYYYVMLIVPFLYFATRHDQFAFAVGTILCFAVSIAAFAANFYLPQHFTLMILLSWFLFGLCVYMALTILFAKQHFFANEGVMIAINQSRYRDKPALFSLSQPISPDSKQNAPKTQQKGVKSRDELKKNRLKMENIRNNGIKNSLETRNNDFKTNDNEFKTRDNEFKTHDNDSKTRDKNSKTHDKNSKTRDNDSKIRNNDSKIRNNDSKIRDNDSKTRDNDSIIEDKVSVFGDNNSVFFNFNINYWTNRIRFASKQIQFRQFLTGFLLAFFFFGVLYGAYCFFLAGKPSFETNFSTNQATNLQKDTATLVFVGDIMMSRGVTRDLEANNRDYTFPFEKMEAYTEAADLSFCNLEGPISGKGEAIAKKYTFNAPPDSIEGLKYAGFDVVSVANNHILDFGETALEDTTAVLGANAMFALGLSTEDAPQTPFVAAYNGITVGMLAYCDPESPFGSAKEYSSFKTRPASGSRENLKRDIAKLRPECAIVVVSMHWGIEYKDEPNQHQRELGRYIIDCGANLVIGHHPHVLQPFEAYKGGLIAYSMGNFIFDQRSKPATRQSRLLKVTVNRAGLVEASYIPLESSIGVWQPTPTQAAFIPIPRPLPEK